ncbi:MAG TPA: VCBS repeat-containing protein [Actinomycetota bacterium]|nr:VCBS repeat-containing protein [Actinomycetota bacterium]
MHDPLSRTTLAPVAAALVAAACVSGGEDTRRDDRAARPPRCTSPCFRDVTADAGLDRTPARTWGAAWADFDSDGDPDLVAGRHFDPSPLYVSAGGRLAPRPLPHGRGFDRHSCAWGEATGDGSPDLACVQGAEHGTGRGPNQLLTRRRGRLVDVAPELGVDDPLGRGRTVSWLDYDSDGDLDLFVGNELRAGAPNVLFRNDRGAFRRVDAGVSDELSTEAVAWADWDRDGDPDVLVLGGELRGARLYENRGGRFVGGRLGAAPGAWTSASWGDFDGDGWPDLHLVRPGRSLVLRNRRARLRPADDRRVRHAVTSAWLDADSDGDLDALVVRGARTGANPPDVLLRRARGRFEPARTPALAGPRAGSGDAAAVADFDRDGRADVYVSNGWRHRRGPAVLLSGRSGTGIGVDLDGGRWNPLGIGAVVRVAAGGRIRRHAVTDGVAYRAQSEPGYVVAGLGDAPAARVAVTWPGGTRDCVRAAAGDVVVVSEGRHPCG